MIEIQGLTKKYGDHIAVNGISFIVEKGEILGFLGPNGAGKTTTMNTITGYMPMSSGNIKVCGFDVSEEPLEVKKRIGYLPENPPLYPEMTVEEYLRFVFELKRVKKEDVESQLDYLTNVVKITDVKKRLIKNLSKGYKQRVGLAQALIGKPEVLVLDEPTVGLDPKQIIEIRELIKELGKEHTIILSSHILTEVNAVCSRVVIINRGKIVAVDTPQNLTKLYSNNAYITMVVEGKAEKVLETISSIEGIVEIQVIENHDDDSNESKYLVKSDVDLDVRKALFYKLAKFELPILELGIKKMSLEDIFIQLTDIVEETAVNDGDENEGGNGNGNEDGEEDVLKDFVENFENKEDKASEDKANEEDAQYEAEDVDEQEEVQVSSVEKSLNKFNSNNKNKKKGGK